MKKDSYYYGVGLGLLMVVVFAVICIRGYSVQSVPVILRSSLKNVSTKIEYMWVKDYETNNMGIKAVENSRAWKSFDYPGQPINPQGYNTIWLRFKLGSAIYKDPSLYFITNDQVFDVYFEGKRIYRYGEFSFIEEKVVPGSPWHLISLPADYNNKYIYFKMSSLFIRNVGFLRNLRIGETGKHIISIIIHEIDNIILASLFIFIGLMSSFMFLINKEKSRLMTSIGFSSVCIGIWIVSESCTKQFFIYCPRVWHYIAIVSFYLIPVGICMFIQRVYGGRENRLMGIWWRFLVGFTAVSLVLDLLKVMPISNTVVLYYVLLFFTISYSIYVTIRAIKRGNRYVRVFTIGLSFLAMFGIYDILGWYFRVVPWRENITHWGMLIFIITMFYISAQSINDISNKIVKYTEEIKSKEASLIEKKRQLDAALEYDKLKTEFFANISHELRTPLNIILTTIQLMGIYVRDGVFIGEGKSLDKYLRIMKQNSYRLIRIVSNLIDLTKIDSGYLKPNLENHNIVNIVEEITLSVADYIKSKGIDLVFDTDLEERTIACDPDKVERIMLNLLSNAVKFSKEGSEITVSLKNDCEYVRITVEDTGIGIPKEKLKSIFERFIQVDRSLTRNHEGSGIGLSLVSALVSLLGGEISVESEYGVGSKFVIKLPATLVEEKDQVIVNSTISMNHVEKVNIEFSDIYMI